MENKSLQVLVRKHGLDKMMPLLGAIEKYIKLLDGQLYLQTYKTKKEDSSIDSLSLFHWFFGHIDKNIFINSINKSFDEVYLSEVIYSINKYGDVIPLKPHQKQEARLYFSEGNNAVLIQHCNDYVFLLNSTMNGEYKTLVLGNNGISKLFKQEIDTRWDLGVAIKNKSAPEILFNFFNNNIPEGQIKDKVPLYFYEFKHSFPLKCAYKKIEPSFF